MWHQPPGDGVRRPEWHPWGDFTGFPAGDRLPVIWQKYDRLITDLHALPKDCDSYGLIQMQELMHYLKDLDTPDEELHVELRYKIRCIE